MADPIPVVPRGTPAADPTKPKTELTQEQIDAIGNMLPPWLKTWWPLIALLIPVLLASGWFGGKTTSELGTHKIVHEKLDKIIEKLDSSSSPTPIPTPAVKRVTYAVTTATDLSILKGLPSGVVEVYPVGSSYNHKGVLVPLPVVITRDASGTDVDVRKLP